MKHLTFADKSMLVGDDVGELLLEYAALLASHGKADTVSLHVYNSDGSDSEATILLDSGAPLMAESVQSHINPPHNDEAVRYLREQMQLITNPPEHTAEASPVKDDYPEFDL